MTLLKEMPLDHLKQLSEWALAAGRLYQSPQTGYVHLYESEADAKAQTIPPFENACFVLALLRSRLVDQMQEAKALLKGLLAFQNQSSGPEKGNFPVYLHEYPHCRNSSLGLQLLAPFYWIYTQFGHILGAELKQQLEGASRLALEQCMRFHELKPFSYTMSVRLSAAQVAYGTIWNDDSLKGAGNERLAKLEKEQLTGWNHTKHLSDLLISLQMVYPSLSQSSWALLWDRMKETWHSNLSVYVGPCVREWQEKEEPQMTLYDLYAGFLSENFSRRASMLCPYHLQGILIQPSTDKFGENQIGKRVVGILNEQQWQIVCHSDWAYTLLEKKKGYPPSTENTHTPLRIVWGDRNSLHSFVCQGGKVEKVEFLDEGESLILDFDLKETHPDGDKASRREVEFFIDFHPDFQFKLNDISANTFELGQKIDLILGKKALSLVFELLEGEGDFVGHLMRGNRPSQIDLKGEKRFQSFDWTLFLRSIRRQGLCKIQARLTFEK